jgi:serine/threonine-protein kinase HipA
MADLTQKIKKLYGHTPQGHAGQLDRESQYVWRYTATRNDCELSLAMPIRAASYNSSQPHPIFSMNLPEGDQFYRLSQRFKKTLPCWATQATMPMATTNTKAATKPLPK